MGSTNKNKMGLVLLLISAALFAMAAYYHSSTDWEYVDFTITTPQANTSVINFPLKMDSSGSGHYQISGQIIKKTFSSTRFQIIPDDELIAMSINGKAVDLSSISIDQRRDYRQGFNIDLAQYLDAQFNHIDVTLYDSGGVMGLDFISAGENISSALLLAMGIAFISCLIFSTPLHSSIKLLIILGLIIRVFYFSITPADTRTHDEKEHIEYAEYLAEYWIPPSIERATGGAFFHPPLYYYTSAIGFNITQSLNVNPLTALRFQQLICLVYSMGFLIFGLLILHKLLKVEKITNSTPPLNFSFTQMKRGPERARLHSQTIKDRTLSTQQSTPNNFLLHAEKPWLFIIIASLFTFWPSSIIHSVRIGNDPLVYFLLAGSIYYIYHWFEQDKFSHLLIGTLFAAGATLTKANGEIMIPVIGIIGLYKMCKTKQWARYLKMSIAPLLIIIVSLAITLGPGLLLKMQGKREQLYIDNINNVSSALRVANTAANYLWFDAKIFINEPFTSPWQDEKGRQYFWNYLAKTGLFGEFNYDGAVCRNAAIVSSFTFILMMLFIIAGLYHLTKNDFKKLNAVALSGLFLFLGITYMRMTFPVNIDFRYILPIIICFCGIYALSIRRFMQIGATKMAYSGAIVSIIFTLANIIFILSI